MLAKSKLEWRDGIGWLDPVNPIEYGKDYFAEYQRRSATDIGRRINAFRIEFVDKYYTGGRLCDVGIGSGAFVKHRNLAGSMTYGWDINPRAVRWLQKRELLRNPYIEAFTALSFWDVIEHIPDYPALLRNIGSWLFVSLPIFADEHHALRSKHFKPGEHCWYFTEQGLIRAMQNCGFTLIDANRNETLLGREDIGTFVFKRT